MVGTNAVTPHPALSPHPQIHALVEQTITWLGDNTLRIALLLGVGTLLVAGLFALKELGERICRNRGERVDWRTVLGRIAARTNFWFIVLLAVRLVDGYADAPPRLDHTIGFLFTIGFTFQAALWARELILGFVEHRAGLTDQDHGALGSAMGIIRLLVSFTLFALALVLVLDNLGVNVTGLVAGLGIGGIAIGLAAQGIFKDLFAALSIIFDHPFRRGDSVRWNSISGTIEAIGLKTTRIRATTGEEVVVGNANLLEKELYNLSRISRRRVVLSVALPYDTSPDARERMPALFRETVEAEPKCTVVRAGIVGVTATGILHELQFDVRSDDYDELFTARDRIATAMLRHLAGSGIAIAGPDGKALPQLQVARETATAS